MSKTPTTTEFEHEDTWRNVEDVLHDLGRIREASDGLRGEIRLHLPYVLDKMRREESALLDRLVELGEPQAGEEGDSDE